MNDECSFDSLRNLSIGTVQSVSPREWRVTLDHDAPHSTAINTGTPTLFPKINGYVLIPNESGALIGVISWIGIENAQYPKRQGFKDFDLIDLPFPQRIMSISPLGELRFQKGKYSIERGVFNYPSVGDIVILPTKEQLQAIVENKDDESCFQIGIAPAAANAPVFVNPNKLFGRHLAVLGNTGSGKSSSVCGIIRWSIKHAQEKISDGKINARFIILDPNGEYKDAFDDFSKVRKFRVQIDEEKDDFKQLRVPAWLWNSFEWDSISEASAKAQRPFLRQALRELKCGSQLQLKTRHLGINYSSLLKKIEGILASGILSVKEFPGKNNFGTLLLSTCEDLEKQSHTCLAIHNEPIKILLGELDQIEKKRFSHEYQGRGGNIVREYFPFSEEDLELSIKAINSFLLSIGWEIIPLGPDEDSPIPYNVQDLPNYIERISQERKAEQYLDFLIMRIRTMLSDNRMASIIGFEKGDNLQNWLEDYIGGSNAENGEIVIIDLSLVPSDVIHLVVAVISRIIFEALQRYRRMIGDTLPTIMVLDEAHVFIRQVPFSENEYSTDSMCRKTFERIAREGRKFGLGLLLCSQRPAELSSTVLSQCNTFLLHRIVNDKDQDLVSKFVPDNLGNLLRELPILPTRKGILLGYAAPIPILVEINELEEKCRPKSSDPSFWNVWTHKEKRNVSWDIIAQEWQKSSEGDIHPPTQSSQTKKP
ncbi:ATP-binding protein [Methanoregula formicica]|uniref:Putative ATPase n=1 Tax=Methanoregula formicica (strain DSM 22288 / NBRC 105244 / SMSP) TaxID=593750 RepID=L0HGK5_METFS|nr:ATP-binding protein [Methanoregula formicica]AGB02926.1 putative ATPase [Methanoregula formicica SMSP]